MKMTKEVLSRFISLEYELKTLLEANPLKKLEQAREEVAELQKSLAEKQQKFHEAQQTAWVRNVFGFSLGFFFSFCFMCHKARPDWQEKP